MNLLLHLLCGQNTVKSGKTGMVAVGDDVTRGRSEELSQLKKAVAIMTPSEKEKAADLNDEQIQKIAGDAGIDAGIFAIFINGYALARKGAS